MKDGASGKGGVEAISQFLGQVDWVPNLGVLRQRMKVNSIFYETGLAKCNKELMKRPVAIRQKEVYKLLGAECPKCGFGVTVLAMSELDMECPKCHAELVPVYLKVQMRLLELDVFPSPETVLMFLGFDSLADAYVSAYEAVDLVFKETARMFGWERFRVNDPELRNYFDMYFFGRLAGEQKIPAEEKQVLQFIFRGNLAGVAKEDAEKLIRLGISVVKYGYLFEVLGATGADVLYRQSLIDYSTLYDVLNGQIRLAMLELYGEARAGKVHVNPLGGGYYAPCLIMPRESWESGQLSKSVEMEWVSRLPIFSTHEAGSLQMLFSAMGSGKCLPWNEEVVTNKGLMKIGVMVNNALLDSCKIDNDGNEISFYNHQNLQVLSFNTDTFRVEWKSIAAFFKGYSKRLVTLKTESGRTIRATPGHSFAVWDTERIKVVNGSDLKIGNGLPLIKKLELPIKPSGYSRDWMTLFGIYVAEGHIQNSDGVRYPIISFADRQEALIIKNLVAKLGYAVSFRYKNPEISSDIRLSAKLTPALDVFGGKAPFKGKGSGASMKTIPDFMLFETEENIKAFLDAYFAGDGWIENKKSEHSRTISSHQKCVSKSKELIDRISLLLLRLGIVCTIRKKTIRKGKYAGNEYWGCAFCTSQYHSMFSSKTHERVEIKGLLLDLLKASGLLKSDIAKHTGLDLRDGKRAKNNLRQSQSPQTIQSIIKFIEQSLEMYPFALRKRFVENPQSLKDDFDNGKILPADLKGQGIRLIRRTSYRNQPYVIVNMPGKVSHRVLERDVPKARVLLSLLKNALNGDVYFDRIVSISNESSDEAVYDLTIPENSIFMLANGLFVHNTYLLSGLASYAVTQKHEIVFSPLNDKSNSFAFAGVPLFGHEKSKRMQKLEAFLKTDMGIEITGLPCVTLNILREKEKVKDVEQFPPTAFDRILYVDDPKSFTVDFKAIMGELKEAAEGFGFSRPTGIVNVRNFDRYDSSENIHVDVQIASVLLDYFDRYRKGHLTEGCRLVIDEISYMAPSQIGGLYGSDASRSAATISDFIKESRRARVSCDAATQMPLEVMNELRNAATNIFFRDLAKSKDKSRSQIDFLLETLQLEDAGLRSVVRDMNEKALLPKHFWFWYNKAARSIQVVRPCPPVFMPLDVRLTPRKLFGLYEKRFGVKVLLDSWDQVEVLGGKDVKEAVGENRPLG